MGDSIEKDEAGLAITPIDTGYSAIVNRKEKNAFMPQTKDYFDEMIMKSGMGNTEDHIVAVYVFVDNSGND